MLDYDIKATKAFTNALSEIKVLNNIEIEKLHRGLDEIKRDCTDDCSIIQDAIKEGVEDVHSLIEQWLFEKVGDIAYKANTGRSRNEQVSCATRLWLMDQLDHIILLIEQLQISLQQKARRHIADVLMGYTHMQQAQPITWGPLFFIFF